MVDKNQVDFTQFILEDMKQKSEKDQAKKNQPNSKRGNFSDFTHFISIPLIAKEMKDKFYEFGNKIINLVEADQREYMQFSSPDTFHLSLAMLKLSSESKQKDAIKSLEKSLPKIMEILENKLLKLKLEKLSILYHKAIGKKDNLPKLMYINVDADTEKLLNKVSNIIIKDLMSAGLINVDNIKELNIEYDHKINGFHPTMYHATIFRIRRDCKYDTSFIAKELEKIEFGTFEISRIDISTRFEYDESKYYKPLSTVKLEKKEEEEAKKE